MRGEMAERNAQLVQCRQHVQRMLLHRIVGVIGRGGRTVAFTAAAPVDADHANAAGKQRRRELNPFLAREIAMDEDDGDVALTPCVPSQIDVTGFHPWHAALYLFRPTVGDEPAGVCGSCAAGDAAARPLIRWSVATGELVS